MHRRWSVDISGLIGKYKKYQLLGFSSQYNNLTIYFHSAAVHDMAQ